MSNIKEQIRQEIDTRRQHMVEELMGHEENCEYHRIKGMHDAYVDLLTFLDYSLPEEKPSDDLELTWEDMRAIRIIKDHLTASINGPMWDSKEFYEEILRRFNKAKNKK